tara:strand:+ start:2073 stop:3902 length:1830 start_codon:yes stop_codon:yes gene_type:complete
MSIIYLSSNDQRPQNFCNDFPSQINLGSNAEISLIGYSGVVKGEDTDVVDDIHITIMEGINDTMTVYRGKIAAATSDKEVSYLSWNCRIPPGSYDPTQLADQIGVSLNNTEYLSQYKGGWTCKFDDITNPDSLWIQTGKARGATNVGENWISYNTGVSQLGIGGIPPVASNQLLSFVAGKPNCESFVCLKHAYIGDSGTPQGNTATSLGFEIEFTTVGAGYEQCQFSMGILPVESATRLTFRADENPIRGYVAPLIKDYIWDTTRPLDYNHDFAINSNGGEPTGFFSVGLVIGKTGLIGIIDTKSRGDNIKSTRDITWTATNLGAAGVKKLGISPRYNAGSGFPVFDLLADVGAGWVLLGSTPINEAGNNLYRNSTKLVYGVCVDPKFIDDGASPPAQLAVDITAKAMFVNGGGALAGCTEPVYLGFTPFPSEQHAATYFPSLDELARVGVVNKQNQSNSLGSTMGFLTQWEEQTGALALTTGFLGDTVLNVVEEIPLCPIIVTCPDLGARGYIGAAGGGGSQSQILGVCPISGAEVKDYAFSGQTKTNWIQLHNPNPIVITRLNIILKDSEGKEIQFLKPNFNVWLKFKCDYPKGRNQEVLSIGNRTY